MILLTNNKNKHIIQEDSVGFMRKKKKILLDFAGFQMCSKCEVEA